MSTALSTLRWGARLGSEQLLRLSSSGTFRRISGLVDRGVPLQLLRMVLLPAGFTGFE